MLLLCIVGDVSFDSAVKYYHKHGNCSYNNTFENVAAVLRQSDLVIGNLENPFVRDDLRKDALIGFNTLLSADPDSVEALKFAGFNLMTLANNHLDDYKTKPINHTVELLLEQGILPFGYDIGVLGNEEPQIPVTAEVYGIKIGFLGYCSTYRPDRDSEGRTFFHCVEKRRGLDAGPAIYTDEAATRDVNNLKAKVDVVVVLMHWGTMLLGKPSQRQQRQAEHLKSLGVNVVIGSHPHVLGGHALEGNSLVAYSLGNFLFAPKEKNAWFYYNRSPPMTLVRKFESYMATDGKNDESLQSRILRVELNKKGVVCASYLPLQIILNPKTKCLQPTPPVDAKWIPVCEHGDEDCLNST